MNKLKALLLIPLTALFLSSCSNPDQLNFSKLSLTDLEGNPAQLDQFQNKLIFLNFWATWCGDCRVEMPTIAHARAELKDADIAYVFISDESPEKIKAFENRYNYGFDYLLLKGSMKKHGIFYIPQTYIIKNGKIVHAATMNLDWDSAESIALLQDLAQ